MTTNIDELQKILDAEVAKRKRQQQGQEGKANSGAKQITPSLFPWRDPATIPPRAWLYGKHLIRGYVSVTVGRTKGGKTANAVAETLAMVTGKPLLGIAPKEPLRVWYVGEDPTSEIELRFAAAAIHYKIDPTDCGDRLFTDSVLDGKIPPIRIAEIKNRAVVVNETEVVDVLIAGLKEYAIDVLILDPLIKFHGVPESDNPAMEAVVSALARVATATRAAVELLHHIRKPSAGQSNAATIDDGRGASAVISAARSGRVFNRMTDEEADKAGIDAKERWRYFRIDEEGNMAPPETSIWRRLASVILPCGESVGVCESWKYPDAFHQVSVADMHWIRALVQEKAYRANSQAEEWIGKPLAERLNLDLEDKLSRAKVNQILKTWIKNGVLATEKRNDNTGRPRDFMTIGDWEEAEDPPEHGDPPEDVLST